MVGIGIYSWDPVTGALEWDERLRAMWELPADVGVKMDVFEAGVHPDDLPRVQRAVASCIDPAGDGRYNIEYRVLGRDELAMKKGAWANIPPKSNRSEPICFSPYLYRARNRVERFFTKSKQCRRVATRYGKLAADYLAFVQLASIRLWFSANES